MRIRRRELVNLSCAIPGIALASALRRTVLATTWQGKDDAPAVKPLPAPAPEKHSMEIWWADLEKEESLATRALLKLSDHPKETAVFLKEKMKPLILDLERLKELLIKLEDAEEKEWKPAFEEFEYFDPRLAVDLETLMTTFVESPLRQRLVAVMSGRLPATLEGKVIELMKAGDDGFNFLSKPGGSWWAEHHVERINSTATRNPKSKWTRAVRAIALLEHFGTPEAVAVLKTMATGHPEAQPTKVAVKALERIAGKPL